MNGKNIDKKKFMVRKLNGIIRKTMLEMERLGEKKFDLDEYLINIDVVLNIK